jgi:hypothetical protein
MRKCFSTCARALSHENPLVRHNSVQSFPLRLRAEALHVYNSIHHFLIHLARRSDQLTRLILPTYLHTY